MAADDDDGEKKVPAAHACFYFFHFLTVGELTRVIFRNCPFLFSLSEREKLCCVSIWCPAGVKMLQTSEGVSRCHGHRLRTT